MNRLWHRGVDWMTAHAGPTKNLSGVKVGRNPLKCSLSERKRSVDFGAEPIWISILTLPFTMCPWMVILYHTSVKWQNTIYFTGD